MTEDQQIIDEVSSSDYKYGFVSDIEQDFAPIGLKIHAVWWIGHYSINATI